METLFRLAIIGVARPSPSGAERKTVEPTHGRPDTASPANIEWPLIAINCHGITIHAYAIAIPFPLIMISWPWLVIGGH